MFGRSRFGSWSARREASEYREKGLPNRLRPLLDFLTGRGIEGASVLDIGFGVGALHFELLKRNAARVTGVEVVQDYMRLATELAGHLGYTGRVDYRLGDFALMHAEVPAADVVVLDRSVCCYPDWEGLVGPSAAHARRFYALVLPVDRWFARAIFRAANVLFRLLRWEYRGYMHPREQIESMINSAGLRRVFTNRTGLWESIVYARTQPA